MPPLPAEAPAWAQRGGGAALTPRPGIPPQLWATREARARIAASGDAADPVRFSPHPLPSPWLYGVHTAGVRFDAAQQAWLPDPLPSRRWFGALPPSGHQVTFHARVLPGWSQLPVPLCARLLPESAQAAGGERVDLSASEPAGTWRCFVHGAHPVELRYTVDLLRPPAPTASALAGLPPEVLAPSTPLRDLPREVRRWVEDAARAALPPWERALAVQRFLLERFTYDEDFLTRPEAQRLRAQLRPGQGVHHLRLLFAGADEATLGRGVCYELNLLAVELLRHLRVPALAASGWLFDQGVVDRPDHLFALVILPTDDGPALLPIDGTAGRSGPTPLLPRRDLSTPGGAAAPHPPAPPSLESQQRAEVALLLAALEHACAVRRQPPPDSLLRLRAQAAALPPGPLLEQLRPLLERLVGAPPLIPHLLALLRGDLRHLTALTPEVQELVRLGYAQLRTVPAYEVLPWTPPGP